MREETSSNGRSPDDLAEFAELGDLADHGRFVRNLAWRLLHDEDAAEEVVQETMLAAVKARPDAQRRSLRPWLATVARNVIRRRFRGASRLRKREEAAAKAEALPATADMVARAEMLKVVSDAVLSLAEPNRSTVLLRYYEDLPPREIAVRQGVGVETVRGRLRRAAEQLRRRLDRLHPEGRAGWVPMLAGLCGFEVPAHLLAGSGGAAAGAEAAPVTASAPGAVVGGVQGLAAAFVLGAVLAGTGAAIGAGAGASSPSPGEAGHRATVSATGASTRRVAPGADPGDATLAGSPEAHARLAGAEAANRALRARVATLTQQVAALDPVPVDPRAFRFFVPEQASVFDQTDWLSLARHMRAIGVLNVDVLRAVQDRDDVSPGLRARIYKENAPLSVFAVRIGPELGGLGANSAYTHPAVLANLIRAALVLVEEPLSRDQEVRLRVLGDAWAAEAERLAAAARPDAPALARIVAEVDAKLRFLEAVKRDVLTPRQHALLFDPRTEGRLQLDMLTPGLLFNLRHSVPAYDRAELEQALLESLFLLAGAEEVDTTPYAWVGRQWVDEVPDILTPRLPWDLDIPFARVDFALAQARAQVRAIGRILDAGRLEDDVARGLREITILLTPRIRCVVPEPSPGDAED